RRDALARRAVGFLLIATTIAAAGLTAAAAPLSRLVLSHRDPTIFRVAVLGLWSFTNLELAYGLLRVDERLRVYATASLANVGMTIAASVVLVVGLGDGARGLLLGNYGASTVVLLALWWTMRNRLRIRGARAERMAVLLRFGLPTVPAEASVYALSIVDRYYIYHDRSQALAGLYSIAIKLAGAGAFIVRAFHYAWPPLGYSITVAAEAGRLDGRWVVFLVIAGRAKVTTRTFPASLAGLVANVVLILTLVPPLGIAGAGIALCGAYVVMLGAMHLLTRRVFRVAFEWRRLTQLALVLGGLSAVGDVLLPAHGLVGFLARAALFPAIPLVLLFTRFAHPQELDQLRALIARVRSFYPPAAESR